MLVLSFLLWRPYPNIVSIAKKKPLDTEHLNSIFREWVLVVGLSMEGVLIAGHLQIIIHRVLCIALWFIIPNTVFCVASERSGKAYLEHT